MSWISEAMSSVPSGGSSMDPMTGGMLAMGGLNMLSNIFQNEKNLQYQRDQIQYMRDVQNQAWAREDNAVQRRVADLKSAGLSPVLAAGSAAASSSPIKIDPMHTEDPMGISGALGGATAAMQIAQTRSSLATAEAQRDLLDSQKQLNTMKSAVLGKEFDLYGVPGGHPKYQDIWGKRITSMIDAVGKGKPVLDKLKSEATSKADKNWEQAGKTPAERAKAQGKWHLFNQF